MKAIAIFLCCSVVLAQGPPKHALNLPEALDSVVTDVKAKSHLKVLLPSRLPKPFSDAKHATVESDSENKYAISMFYKLDVGDSGFAASFSADAHPEYGPKDIHNVRKVRLSNGLVGYFREVTCGGSCAPANLWWEEDHVLYSLQLRLRSDVPYKDQERMMTAVANSAILAGPR